MAATLFQARMVGLRGPAAVKFAQPPVPGQFLVKTPGGPDEFVTVPGMGGADGDLREHLASSAGSALVGFEAGGLLPVIRSIADRGQLSVYASDYQGFDAGGGTSSRDAVLRAADALTKGGDVLISAREAVLIDDDLELPPNTAIRGPMLSPGFKKDNQNPTPFHTLGGRLMLNPAKNFRVGGGGGVTGLIMHPKGMTFPQTSPSSFAGTGVIINGDDSTVSGCAIFGFDKAIYSSGFARIRLDRLQIDANNVLDISDCKDVEYISGLHAWPWATMQPDADWRNLHRTGVGVWLHDTVDHAKLFSNFIFGYQTNYLISNVNAPLLVGSTCDHLTQDGVPLVEGSKGLVIEGYTARARVIGFQSSGMDSACLEINVSYDQAVMVDGDMWVSGEAGCAVRVLSGDAYLSGSLTDHTTGIESRNANSQIFDSLRYSRVTNPVNHVGTTLFNYHDRGRTFAPDMPDGHGYGAGTMQARSVPSASDVALPLNGDIFHITGNENIGGMDGGWCGRKITLIFEGNLTIYNDNQHFNSIRIPVGNMPDGNFAVSGPIVIHLIHDGATWWKV